jgi:hypothetical protein
VGEEDDDVMRIVTKSKSDERIDGVWRRSDGDDVIKSGWWLRG